MKRPLLFALTIATVSGRTQAQPTPERRWSLSEAAELPAWLRAGAQQRTRLLSFLDSPRPGSPASMRALELRSQLQLEVRRSSLIAGLEVMDSRAFTTRGAPVNNTISNALDVLQGYVGLRGEDLLVRGDQWQVQVGRMTLDLGNRRLVARNDFRNTINAFTGVHGLWTGPGGALRLRLFGFLPVIRRPSDAASLEDNEIERDRETFDQMFGGLVVETRTFSAQDRAEWYLLALRERDGTDAPTSDRRLLTPGARLLRRSRPGQPDYQVEVALQGGQSRASNRADDRQDLEHRAFFVHGSVGQNLRWPVRVSLHYDHASGDQGSKDGKNQRFDTLFGARRFDLGPTSFYGLLARSNLRSPGLRVEAWSGLSWDAMLMGRLAWLDQPQDGWVGVGLRDTSAASSFLGRQLEGRFRWHPLPGRLTLDTGLAVLQRGAFGAQGRPTEPVWFFYTQSQLTL
ncbi:MAG: alginate export family protein [Polyangiaceae bacterium]|jgi:hypothetical protein|nr:alginate export family protein [Polyangiaceae bacterium]